METFMACPLLPPSYQYFIKSTAVQMGGVLPYMGGVLHYKWEVYCWASLSPNLRSQEGPAIQMGGVLPYKLGVYCSTFFETSRGWVSETLLTIDFGIFIKSCNVLHDQENHSRMFVVHVTYLGQN